MLNYLKEDMAFLTSAIDAPLSPRAHVFWHYLLYFNNQAAIKDEHGDYYWPVWFAVDNRVLVKALGVRDSGKLYDYRKQLIRRGYIRYNNGGVRGYRDAYPAGYRLKDYMYSLTPFVTGYEERMIYPPGYPLGVPVWVDAPDVDTVITSFLPLE